MNDSLLFKILGYRASLVSWDTTVLDRWLWLKRRLPQINGGKKLLDVGCGSGAFSLGAGVKGYEALGLSWDEGNQRKAVRRAQACRLSDVSFEVQDIRNLGERQDLKGQFDQVICFEAIEHIVNDFKLMKDMANCLKPGGHLLLTTPNFHFRAMTVADNGGADPQTETGGHVRRGYSKQMLIELCEASGLVCEEISFCSGFLSQKTTQLLRVLSTLHPMIGLLLILPLRPLIPIFDNVVTRLLSWPGYSICLEAYKPREKNRGAFETFQIRDLKTG